jgi:hypothetical protein
MGDWSMWITLSTCSSPSMARYSPGRSRAPSIFWASARCRVSRTRVDFPDPETPVTHVMAPSGIVTSIPLRLLARHPRIRSAFPFELLRRAGTGISFFPERYCP